MQSSNRFLRAIAEHTILTPRRLEALSRVDSQRVYVENIRSILGGPAWVAKTLCETAVRKGIFTKHIQLLCPDGAVAKTIHAGETLPTTVRCVKEIDGYFEETLEAVEHLDKLEYYSYVRGHA